MRWNYYYNYGKHNNESGFKIISYSADLLIHAIHMKQLVIHKDNPHSTILFTTPTITFAGLGTLANNPAFKVNNHKSLFFMFYHKITDMQILIFHMNSWSLFACAIHSARLS